MSKVKKIETEISLRQMLVEALNRRDELKTVALIIEYNDDQSFKFAYEGAERDLCYALFTTLLRVMIEE